MLLNEGNANVNLQDNFGYTPLIHCIKLTSETNTVQSIKITKLLLTYNADINMEDNDKKTAIFFALKNKNVSEETLKLLINKNPKIDFDNNLLSADELNVLAMIYKSCEKFDEMKKCSAVAIKMGSISAKLNLFNYYCGINKINSISKEEVTQIKNLFKKKASFVILFKSKYFHYAGECPVCFENVNDIVSLPCHSEHKMCTDCVNKLKKNICPFCREFFYRNIQEFNNLLTLHQQTSQTLHQQTSQQQTIVLLQIQQQTIPLQNRAPLTLHQYINVLNNRLQNH